jgi:hypothetical protein
MRKGQLLSLALVVLAAPLSQSQQSQLDLNTYYRFPLSLGVEFQSLTPFAAYPVGAPYSLYDISLQVRWPIPPFPVLQPLLRIGMMSFDSQNQAEPMKWTHRDFYGQLGVAYAHRFAKYFEIGAEVLGGASESYYDNLVPDVPPPVGYTNLLFEAGGRVSLNPSFNFTVEIHPNVKYLLPLGEVRDFNGFLFGIGFTGSYRFGQDPDAPAAVIRALRFDKLAIPSSFAAMQSWYASNSIGSVTLVNTEKSPLTDVEVSFFQKGYMDSPTAVAKLPEIKPGASVDVGLRALFNDNVFSVEGVTPLTGEVIVNYRIQGRPVEQRQSASFDLYDKRAIVWNDDRKVGALITPEDSALKNYGGFIRQACREEVAAAFSGNLQTGMQVFSALGEIGCLYQANTLLPFTRVQGNPTVVDTVHLARETLKSGLGDCSDLTVLYDSILESLAVPTGFITVPGHIYAAVDTKVPARDYRKVNPDRTMTLELNGELWVPVEITLIGKTGFMEAWRKGMEEWSASDPQKRAFYVTQDAWKLYRSVGLKEIDLGLQYGRKEAIVQGFRNDLGKAMDSIVGPQAAAAQATGKKEDWNKAGVAYAQFMRYPQAEEAFRKALSSDPHYLAAQINLGNILFLRQTYDKALSAYQGAQVELARMGQEGTGAMTKLLINISRTYYQMESFEDAKAYYQKAAALDADKAREYAYLAERSGSGARAAEERDPRKDIIFLEE